MSLLLEFLKAAVGIGVALALWLAVLTAWRRAFPATSVDEDMLAGRTSCHGCTCTEPCEDKLRAESEITVR